MNTIIQFGIHKQTFYGQNFLVRVHQIKLSVFHFLTQALKAPLSYFSQPTTFFCEVNRGSQCDTKLPIRHIFCQFGTDPLSKIIRTHIISPAMGKVCPEKPKKGDIN